MRANRKRHRQETILIRDSSQCLLRTFMQFLDAFSRPTNNSRRILRAGLAAGQFNNGEIRTWKRAWAAIQLIIKTGKLMEETMAEYPNEAAQ